MARLSRWHDSAVIKKDYVLGERTFAATITDDTFVRGERNN